MRDPGRARGDQLAATMRSTDDAAQPPASPYVGWTVAALRERAAEAGIVGRSRMRKDQLVRALRDATARDLTDRSG